MKSNLRLIKAANRNGKIDVLYCQAINDLIPEAEAFADVQAGLRPQTADEDAYFRFCNRWNFHFHTKMDELADSYRLRTQSYQRTH